jgi:transposase
VHRARESEDFTHNKSDETDAMIIARLVTELRCYLPERAEPVWARLRHLGARRVALVTDATAARQQITDLLECAWPAALQAAAKPMGSASWLAAMTVLLDRVGASGDLAVIRRWGWSRFAAAVRRELPRHGATRWYSAIVRAVFDAAADPARAAAGVSNQRTGALERIRFTLADLGHVRAETALVETRMVEVLDELGLTTLATSIPGLSAVGAAAILAETGDPTRFSCARALVKHAGLCPRDNASGKIPGQDRNQRPRPAPAPPGSLAGGVARIAQQPRARRPAFAPDRPRRQPAPRPASPSPAACCASCTPSSPPAPPGTPPSPADSTRNPQQAREGPPLPHDPKAP